jgi:hypothetical protein
VVEEPNFEEIQRMMAILFGRERPSSRGVEEVFPWTDRRMEEECREWEESVWRAKKRPGNELSLPGGW